LGAGGCELPEFKSVEVPETIEGWYILYDCWSIDWERVHALSADERNELAKQADDWLANSPGKRGDSAAYSVISQKGDIMFVHYRDSPDAISRTELALRATKFFHLLKPSYSYFAVTEVSLYEVQAMATRRLIDRGLERGSSEFDAALGDEMEKQKERMSGRLWGEIPPQRYICFYPMSKRRGETVNWYALPLSERRAMMRGHGSIGHKYAETVKQVIGGSVGLDDWEWGVSLHSEHMLVFKKLIYEMRFDPATSWFGEFGPFYLGVRLGESGVSDLLQGNLPKG
jgi:peroxiredoxin